MTSAPDDAPGHDAAALVAAAAPVIWRGMLNANNQLDFSGVHAKRVAAAALAPALRELAAQASMMHAAEWLSRLADALDADVESGR